MALVNELYNGLRIRQSSDRTIRDGYWHSYITAKKDGEKNPVFAVQVKIGDKKAVADAVKAAKKAIDEHTGKVPKVTITQAEEPKAKKKFRGAMRITTEGPVNNPRVTDAEILEDEPADPLKGKKAWRDNLDRFQKGGGGAKQRPGATKSTQAPQEDDEDY